MTKTRKTRNIKKLNSFIKVFCSLFLLIGCASNSPDQRASTANKASHNKPPLTVEDVVTEYGDPHLCYGTTEQPLQATPAITPHQSIWPIVTEGFQLDWQLEDHRITADRLGGDTPREPTAPRRD